MRTVFYKRKTKSLVAYSYFFNGCVRTVAIVDYYCKFNNNKVIGNSIINIKL